MSISFREKNYYIIEIVIKSTQKQQYFLSHLMPN